MMCSSYRLASQRTQTLLNSGRKWVLCYNVWDAAVDRPPWSPCPSKLMDTNVSPRENVSWAGKEMETWKYRKMAGGNGAKMTHRSIRDALKWGKRDVSQNACVLSDLLSCVAKRPLLRGITSFFKALFSEREKEQRPKITVSVCFLSIFFPLHLKAAI